jgi:hypothetical protein
MVLGKPLQLALDLQTAFKAAELHVNKWPAEFNAYNCSKLNSCTRTTKQRCHARALSPPVSNPSLRCQFQRHGALCDNQNWYL